METVVASISSATIAAVSAIVVCVLNNSQNQKKIDEMHNQSVQELKNEIEIFKVMLSNLTAKVEKHNNVIERTYALEKKADVFDEKMKVANNRIADLEVKGDKK